MQTVYEKLCAQGTRHNDIIKLKCHQHHRINFSNPNIIHIIAETQCIRDICDPIRQPSFIARREYVIIHNWRINTPYLCGCCGHIENIYSWPLYIRNLGCCRSCITIDQQETRRLTWNSMIAASLLGQDISSHITYWMIHIAEIN